MHDHWDADYVNEVEARAKQGDVNAMNILAGLYNNQANFSASLSWYEKAAAAGSAEAMYQLGFDCAYHNPKEALNWYRKAASLGHERALEEIANHDDAIKRLAEIVGESAASLRLTWHSEGKIAAIIAKKFPKVDPLSLADHELIDMMSEVGLLRILPSFSRPGGDKDALFAIKCALAQIIRGDMEAERAAVLSDIAAAGRKKVEADGWVFYTNPERTGIFKARPDGSVCMPILPPPGVAASNYRNLRPFGNSSTIAGVVIPTSVNYDCDIEYGETKKRDTVTLAITPSRTQATYGLS